MYFYEDDYYDDDPVKEFLENNCRNQIYDMCGDKKESDDEDMYEKKNTEAESEKNTENKENTEKNNELIKTNNEVIIKTCEDKKVSNHQEPFNDSNFAINQEQERLIEDFSDININSDNVLNLIDNNLINENEKSENTSNILKKKRGRNGPGCSGGDHNKYSDDNIRRKVKHLVLKNNMDFINGQISKMYSKINQGIFTKKLLTINQRQISNATIDFNKKFLHKKLKDIFSDDISTRYTNFLPEHNKILINSLMNDQDEEKREYFNGLFNLSFMNCLEHFRGSADFHYLEGMATFDEVKGEFEKDKQYLQFLEDKLSKYEQIIGQKNGRIAFSNDY